MKKLSIGDDKLENRVIHYLGNWYVSKLRCDPYPTRYLLKHLEKGTYNVSDVSISISGITWHRLELAQE